MLTTITSTTVTHKLPCLHDAGLLDPEMDCTIGSMTHPLGDNCELCVEPMACCGRMPDDLHTAECPDALAMDAADYPSPDPWSSGLSY